VAPAALSQRPGRRGITFFRGGLYRGVPETSSNALSKCLKTEDAQLLAELFVFVPLIFADWFLTVSAVSKYAQSKPPMRFGRASQTWHFSPSATGTKDDARPRVHPRGRFVSFALSACHSREHSRFPHTPPYSGTSMTLTARQRFAMRSITMI
jgi:hypothetical protein